MHYVPKPRALELFHPKKLKEQKKTHDLWADSSAPAGALRMTVSHPGWERGRCVMGLL